MSWVDIVRKECPEGAVIRLDNVDVSGDTVHVVATVRVPRAAESVMMSFVVTPDDD